MNKRYERWREAQKEEELFWGYLECNRRGRKKNGR